MQQRNTSIYNVALLVLMKKWVGKKLMQLGKKKYIKGVISFYWSK